MQGTPGDACILSYCSYARNPCSACSSHARGSLDSVATQHVSHGIEREGHRKVDDQGESCVEWGAVSKETRSSYIRALQNHNGNTTRGSIHRRSGMYATTYMYYIHT